MFAKNKNKQRVLREMSVVLRHMTQRVGQPFCFFNNCASQLALKSAGTHSRESATFL
jgi:hypothetical protein